MVEDIGRGIRQCGVRSKLSKYHNLRRKMSAAAKPVSLQVLLPSPELYAGRINYSQHLTGKNIPLLCRVSGLSFPHSATRMSGKVFCDRYIQREETGFIRKTHRLANRLQASPAMAVYPWKFQEYSCCSVRLAGCLGWSSVYAGISKKQVPMPVKGWT